MPRQEPIRSVLVINGLLHNGQTTMGAAWPWKAPLFLERNEALVVYQKYTTLPVLLQGDALLFAKRPGEDVGRDGDAAARATLPLLHRV